jgi:predicted nucleic acid-binding protein
VKIFVDTNVWLSAFFGRGLCADLIDHLVHAAANTHVSEASDPSDALILAAALAAGADLFVTGDKALLDLGEVQGMPILDVRTAYLRLRGLG